VGEIRGASARPAGRAASQVGGGCGRRGEGRDAPPAASGHERGGSCGADRGARRRESALCNRSRLAPGRGARSGRAAPRRRRSRPARGARAFVCGGAGRRGRDRSATRRASRGGGGKVTDWAEDEFAAALLSGLDALEAARREVSAGRGLAEVGEVTAVARGVATVSGLPGAVAGETVTLGRGAVGLISDLREKSIGVVLLAGSRDVHAGAEVRRTGRQLDVP